MRCWDVAGLLMGVVVAATAISSAEAPALTAAAGGFAGSETCRMCHEELFAPFERNVHSQSGYRQRGSGAGDGCESCHGPGAAHADDPSEVSVPVTFAPDLGAKYNLACLACHRDDQFVSWFQRGAHGRNDLTCGDCHLSPHIETPLQLRRSGYRSDELAPVLGRHLKGDGDELCMSCHPQLRGQLAMPFHHPVLERALQCTSCHNPHGTATFTQHRGRNPCVSCHEDKRGPWAFEHAPVAEGCTSCHEPHGSVAPGLLRSAEPFLCLSCHSLPDDRHGVEIGGTRFSRAIYERCTSCHGAIHGSHGDRHLKK